VALRQSYDLCMFCVREPQQSQCFAEELGDHLCPARRCSFADKNVRRCDRFHAPRLSGCRDHAEFCLRTKCHNLLRCTSPVLAAPFGHGRSGRLSVHEGGRSGSLG
jgi:hypothetical protein